uniref:Kinesin motor domain-containing protein n=1 Tax=Panagrolaimus superbus TaxID=310955 RepID=A0A914YX32_9BILA
MCHKKQDLLYSRIQYSPTSNGIFVCAIQWIFKLIEEFRVKKKDIRYSVRISALHFSQKSDKVIDLLSDFANEDNSENEVKCTEDPALGILIENRSEIRVETVDQALYYLDRVHDHRASGK